MLETRDSYMMQPIKGIPLHHQCRRPELSGPTDASGPIDITCFDIFVMAEAVQELSFARLLLFTYWVMIKPPFALRK